MAARRDIHSVSSFQSLVHWLRLKNYQYEVTFSLYMLTYTEKIVFNSILLTLVSLLLTAAFFYLPNHLFIIYSRVWYYISGEFVAHSHAGSLAYTAKEFITSSGAVGSGVSQSIAQQVVTETISAMRGEL